MGVKFLRERPFVGILSCRLIDFRPSPRQGDVCDTKVQLFLPFYEKSAQRVAQRVFRILCSLDLVHRYVFVFVFRWDTEVFYHTHRRGYPSLVYFLLNLCMYISRYFVCKFFFGIPHVLPGTL